MKNYADRNDFTVERIYYVLTETHLQSSILHVKHTLRELKMYSSAANKVSITVLIQPLLSKEV